MTIETLEFGEDRLFCLLGRFFCSREAHKDLGGPIFGSESMTWFVALEEGRAIGFCTLRVEKTAYVFDYAYVMPEWREKGVYRTLSAARQARLETLPPLPVRVCAREQKWPIWEGRGFVQKQKRGQWIYGELPGFFEKQQEATK